VSQVQTINPDLKILPAGLQFTASHKEEHFKLFLPRSEDNTNKHPIIVNNVEIL